MFIAGQIVGGVAHTVNVTGRLFRKQSTNLIFSCIANLLIAVSFYLLSAYMGAVCMLVSAVRTFVFYLYAKNGWHKNLGMLFLFIGLYLVTNFLSFTNWLEYTIIALKGISYTYGAWQHNPTVFRIMSIFSGAFTIWYNIYYLGYVNIIGEILCIIGVLIVMMYEYVLSKKNNEQKTHQA